MRIDDLRLGFRTDFILHEYDAQVIEREDCLVVRTPGNPTFYWGNCLVLGHAPRDDELGHWLARFDAEIGALQPESRHVAIGVDAEPAGEDLPSWRAAGFALKRTTTMRLRPGGAIAPRRPPCGDVEVKRLDLSLDSDAVIEVESTDSDGYEPAGYRLYLQRQHARYDAMRRDGRLEWFGAYADGTLAATCGLIRTAALPGATARFQRVVTHADWRRRGLCSALVHAVSDFAFGTWGAAEVVMVADPDDVAIGIYRSLGFADIERDWGLQRQAPQDRPA